MDILQVQNMTKSFGGIHAVDHCTFSISEGSVSGLIGPNGAGKTTLFHLLSGLLSPDDGHIYFFKKNITRCSPHKRARKGIGRSFQTIRLFPELSVVENLMLAFKENKEGLYHAFTSYKKHQSSLERKARKLLESVNLEEKAELKANELSYGQQKLLALLRIEAQNSKLILLDEPTAGINPTMIQSIVKIIHRLKREGTTFFIVEHNMPFIMNLCERIIVMDNGRILAEGKPREIQSNEAVLEAYLGKKH